MFYASVAAAAVFYELRAKQGDFVALESAIALFHSVDEKLDSAIKPLAQKYGLTEAILEKVFSEIKLEAENY